jgi:hypothetical protein
LEGHSAENIEIGKVKKWEMRKKIVRRKDKEKVESKRTKYGICQWEKNKSQKSNCTLREGEREIMAFSERMGGVWISGQNIDHRGFIDYNNRYQLEI